MLLMLIHKERRHNCLDDSGCPWLMHNRVSLIDIGPLITWALMVWRVVASCLKLKKYMINSIHRITIIKFGWCVVDALGGFVGGFWKVFIDWFLWESSIRSYQSTIWSYCNAKDGLKLESRSRNMTKTKFDLHYSW